MTSRTAARFSGIRRSATFAVLERVHALRAEGVDVLDLGGGEPDFDTPGHVVEAATRALDEGRTHYAPSRGLPELLAAVAEKLERDNGIVVRADRDIIVTPSAKHALFISLLALLDPGDEVLVPTPSWVSYASMARLVGAVPVSVPLDAADGFRLTRDVLERYVTPRTKVLLLNTPNNPTGRVLSPDEARTVSAFVRDHDLLVVADEIYEKIVYGGARHLSLASLPGCADRTLTVNGFSKAHAMTGWRLGYLCGPTDLVGEVLKAQQHSVGCAGTFVQYGGLAALTGPQDEVAAMTREYAARRELVVSGLNRLPGVRCALPEGSFYVFPDIRGTGFATSAEFAAWLLDEARVAVTPGSAFGPGGEGHVRLSFATSRAVIDEAVHRTGDALARRSPGFAGAVPGPPEPAARLTPQCFGEI
ncbi:pyridoxal phosphate-dependent aminotransferase [Streptomyces olivaceus]|uniref:pyridoxal phosphate-dependent aminotransferase n=1 Tax=Streptomyces TaxID=1883 RepID=UPI001CCE20F5|nr:MULTISPECIES: pyridoxal phosphate-dependent aminotransferase [Streptomyces]MBZ6137688.1 pyridoxal phosphate-dependent aminotransferase [Streptomyces olivaceus]MBZ6170307.1 pyridoxal phosphate-dependent aminotransferase [Streptomyces olivaceus]MBZ6177154.1 pyridoxal phosphate-dependent aminotransferase [Streptomyces olivaceus]MBZ6183975.1 pyridoxal phosphate-dependent aminotransferase [Streptomyces olivaceus]MBZ6255321.1 pyridoxal phosphate-dependent aminotransferase [Streptomyces olivaceus]